MIQSTASKRDKNTTDSDWKKLLSPDEFFILRQKGTEPAGSGQYNRFDLDSTGVYSCAGCGSPLFEVEKQFKSGCGWPAFWDSIPGAVDRTEDNAYGMKRIEITCSNCGGHLGHVFQGEGFSFPTDERHCVNSISIKLNPDTK